MPISWESFLARYRALARNLAAGITGSRDDADDVVQEAMLALLRAERSERAGGDRFSSLEHTRNYFLKTVRNLALQRRGKAAHHEPLAEVDLANERLDGVLGDELERTALRLAALEAAIAELDPEERALFETRLRERRTLADISEHTGVPISTLHSRERALLERLRREVERRGRER